MQMQHAAVCCKHCMSASVKIDCAVHSYIATRVSKLTRNCIASISVQTQPSLARFLFVKKSRRRCILSLFAYRESQVVAPCWEARKILLSQGQMRDDFWDSTSNPRRYDDTVDKKRVHSSARNTSFGGSSATKKIAPKTLEMLSPTRY